MSPAICDKLDLQDVNNSPLDSQSTNFTLSIDARTGITTGTSAQDRARTVAVAIAEESTGLDLIRGKGHVLGLRARDGGVLVRRGTRKGASISRA